VYLAADAVRLEEPWIAEWFRRCALVTGVIAGVLALVGLVVVHRDARLVSHGITAGRGLVAVVVSAVAGVATLVLVLRRRYEPARFSGALAVAAIIAGWALAQRPTLLPGLTVHQAAAGRATLVATLVCAAIGLVILTPSLALLFGLVLRGRLDKPRPEHEAHRPVPSDLVPNPRPLVAVAGVCLVAGLVLLVGIDASWARLVGTLLLAAFAVIGFVAIASPAGLLGDRDDAPPA
jgi:cytochrome d ubiquinol oxidase subunit II